MTFRAPDRFRGILLPAALFVFLPLAIHAPVWTGRIDFFSGPASDLIPYIYGIKSFQYQAFQRSGEIPLWNSHLLLGQPVVGNIQHALFYPPNTLFWLFPFFTALWISQAVHLSLAGFGAWLLARETGSGAAASLATGGLFMLNGRLFYYIHAGWLGYISAACWLPLILWAALRVLGRPGLGYASLLGALLALSLLGGTPQYAFMGYCLLALHGAIRMIDRSVRGTGGRAALAGRLVWAGAVFFVLAAIQILPSAEQAFLSSRPLAAGQPLGFHLDWNLRQWVRFLVRPEVLPRDYAWELCGYIGIGGLALAVSGLASRLRKWDLVSVWGILPVLLSMGPAIPFLDRWVRAVPGLALLVTPSRYLIFTVLILSLAAGWGLQYIIDNGGRARVRSARVPAAVCLVLGGLYWLPATDPGANLRFAATLGISALFLIGFGLRPGSKRLWLLIAWLLADPLRFDARLLTGYRAADLAPPQRILSALSASPGPVRVAVIQPARLRQNLVSVLPDAVFVKAGIDRIGGYEPLATLRALRFLTRMDGTPAPDRPLWGIRLFGFVRPALFRLAGVTHLISTEKIERPGLVLVAADQRDGPDFHGGRWDHQRIYLYAVAGALPRAFFIPSGRARAEAVVNLTRPSPNHVLLSCQAPGPGTVVFTETVHPGWQARVDGTPADIRPFVDTFMAVDLAAGIHRIDLDFLPGSYVTGRRLTLAGLILLVMLAGHRLYRVRRPNRNRAGAATTGRDLEEPPCPSDCRP